MSKNQSEIAFIKVLVATFILLWGTSMAFLPSNFAKAADEPPVLDVPQNFFDETGTGDTTQTTPSGNQDSNTTSGTIKIKSAEAKPISFNPLTGKTTIIFTISADAVIELKILDNSGSTAATLIDNLKIKGNQETSQVWDGTDGKATKTVVPAGKYFYKLTAKDPTTLQTKDSLTGEVNVIYAGSFEDINPGANGNNTVVDQNGNLVNPADLTVNNNPPDTTTDTGPGILLYALLPAIPFLGNLKRALLK